VGRPKSAGELPRVPKSAGECPSGPKSARGGRRAPEKAARTGGVSRGDEVLARAPESGRQGDTGRQSQSATHRAALNRAPAAHQTTRWFESKTPARRATTLAGGTPPTRRQLTAGRTRPSLSPPPSRTGSAPRQPSRTSGVTGRKPRYSPRGSGHDPQAHEGEPQAEADRRCRNSGHADVRAAARRQDRRREVRHLGTDDPALAQARAGRQMPDRGEAGRPNEGKSPGSFAGPARRDLRPGASVAAEEARQAARRRAHRGLQDARRAPSGTRLPERRGAGAP
jgi:hypothetical protein